MIRRLLLFIVVAVPLVLSSVGVKAETQIPKPEGDIYVQDFAHVLSNDEKSDLIQLGRSLDQKTKAQIAVLTIPSLKGRNLEEYAVDAFRTYQLGDKKLNNGVLLFLVINDKKIRIEVGYGLEGALPDGKVGRILDQYAIPYLKNNQADKAVVNTYKKLFNEVSNEYHLSDTSNPKAYKTESSLSFWKTLLIGIGVIILIIIDMKFFGGAFTYLILNIFSAFMRGGGGNGGNKGGGGSSGGGGASRRW